MTKEEPSGGVAVQEPELGAPDPAPTEQASSDKAKKGKPAKKGGQAKKDSQAKKNKRGKKKRKSGRRVPLSTVVAGVLAAALLVTTITFYWRDHSMREAQADVAHAESVAGKYAVGAATIDYKSLDPWLANMKKGVSPELQKKYDAIGPTMPQILVPLKLQATGNLVTAKVVDENAGVYRVVAVVAVSAKNVQIPDGSTTNAVYSVTLDKNKGWLITSVGDPTGGDQPIPGAPPTPR